MKLLITTQTVDKNDPILGFFHRWLTEFAKHFERIDVICLREGVHELPAHVHVHSLGKEYGESRVKYILRFYHFLFNLRGTYECVFIHMNPHYVLLGGIFWKLSRIPIFFWRNHARMNMMTRIAAFFATRIFYTSPYACTSRYSHAMKMPVGIDTEIFVPQEKKENTPRKILFLGRISPVKRVEIFIEAGKLLPSGFELHIYGDDPTKEQKYITGLKQDAAPNTIFHEAIKNDETPNVYRTHDAYVNLTPNGSMDKTVLEAVACGVPTIVTNESFGNVLPAEFIVKEITPQILADKIVAVCRMTQEEKREQTEKSRVAVVEGHSLVKLGELLYKYIHG